MSIWDDMVSAVEDYPETSIILSIVDVDPPGDVLNEGEVATFKVQLDNKGPLSLTSVTLRIKGLNGATVANSGAAALFVSEFVTSALPTIRGHNISPTITETFKFKAPSSTGVKSLVQATLEAWNPTLLHILNDHSDPHEDVPPKATYTTNVSPV